MGIVFGKAAIHQSMVPFAKVGKAAIMKLLTAFHHLTDGFGISAEELGEMLTDLHNELQLAPDVLKVLSNTYFEVMDTDQNGLVDGLELLCVMAICSGMKKTEIVEFCLSLYDFNNSAELCYDELVLALKSACTGLCKLHNPLIKEYRERLIMPADRRLEEVASETFDRLGSGKDILTPAGQSTKSSTFAFDVSLDRKNIKELTDALLTIPEVCSWLGFFSNFTETRELPIYTDEEVGDLYQIKKKLLRSKGEQAVTRWDIQSKPNSHGPVAQWKSQVALLTPVEYATVDVPRTFPECKIELGWVYGFQTEKCHNALHYNRLNDIIYPISRYVIIYSSQSHSQRVMSQHIEEVTALKMHPKLTLVASGEDGENPQIMVWNSETLQVLFQARGHHKDGISSLAFSPNGRMLLSVDNHEVKTIIVTRWEDGSIIYKDTVRGNYSPRGALLNKATIVCSCDTKLWFWTKHTEGYVRRAGIFPKNKPEEAIVTMLPTGNGENLITGMVTGRLMLWVGINCIRVVKAHTTTVAALAPCNEGFLSAGKDSRIRMWTYTLEPRFLFDVSRFGMLPSLVGIAMSIDATSILFGTQGADIFEISAVDGSDLRGGPIVKSHSSGTIYALDTHPSKLEYTTVGSDKTVRVIDMQTKTLLKMAVLDVEGRAVAYSPLGDVLAVATENTSTTGSVFVILNEETLQIIHSARDTKYSATVLKFSPDGETLAIGIADGSVYLYSVSDDYELIARCSRHVQPVLAIDFSREGEYLRSNSVDGELYYFNVDDGAYQSNVSSMRDVVWSTHHCVYSWHTKGVHSYPNDHEAMVCCAVPPPDPASLLEANAVNSNTNESGPTLSIGRAQQQVICGSNLGQLRAHNFPAVHEVADHFRFQAHCHGVVNVRFSFDGSLFFSVGKSDRAILQWHNKRNEDSAPAIQEGDATVATAESLSEIAFELLQGPQVYRDFRPRPAEMSLSILNEVKRDYLLDRYPWARNIVPPTNTIKIATDVPPLPLHLEFVYGYETRSLRNNITYNERGELVYTAGAYGLVWNPITNAQRVYKVHANKITAFACSADGNLIATGDTGKHCRVTIWDSQTCTTLATLPEMQAYTVSSLRFSQSTQYLAVASNDEFHTISIYDWQTQNLQCKLYAGTAKVLDMMFVEFDATKELPAGLSVKPTTPLAETSNVRFAVVGVQHLTFWQGVTGRFPTCLAANWKEIGFNQTFLTCQTYQNRVVVGTSDGNLYMFDPTTGFMQQMIKIHNGAVFAMTVSRNGQLLITGGQDGAVRVWDAQFECLKEYAMEVFSKMNHFHAVRALSMRGDGSTILVGTQGAELLEISMKEGTLVTANSQIRGHGSALYALASHPIKEHIFVTAGDDALLRVWDNRHRRVVKSLKLELGSRAVAFHPAGNMLAVGLGTGKRTKGKLHAKEGVFTLYAFDSLKVIFESHDCPSMITTIQFSPNGKTLAIGSDDCAVYLYDIQDMLCSHRHTLRHHTAPIVSLDFSVSSILVMSIDQADRVAYTMAMTGLVVNNADEVRDERWASYTSPILYDTQGLWLSQPGDVQPTTCAKAANGTVLASANTLGDVMLTRFPATERMGFQRPGSHVGRVGSISWQVGDTCFLTVGAEDTLLLQWRCGIQASALEVPAPVAATSAGVGDSSTVAAVNQGTREEYHFVPREDTNEDNASHFLVENPLDYQFESIFHDHGADIAARTRSIISSMSVSAAGTMTVMAGQDPATYPAISSVNDLGEFHDDTVLFPWRSMLCDPSNRSTYPVLANHHLHRLADTYYHGSQRNSGQPSLFYNPEGDFIYVIGNLGVIYDRNTTNQRLYQGHLAEISALNINHQRSLVATADRQSYPEIHLWDSLVGAPVKILKGYHRHNVRALSFSSNSQYLLSIGEDAYHSLVVFYSPSGRWHDGYHVSSTSISLGNMAFCLYTAAQPLYPMFAGGEDSYLHMFRHVQGSLEHVTQRLDNHQRIQSLLCGFETLLRVEENVGGGIRACVLIGSSVGFLYNVTMVVSTDAQTTVSNSISGHSAQGGCQVLQRISAHEGALVAIVPVQAPSLDIHDSEDVTLTLPQSIVTLGRDQCLRIWSNQLKLLQTLELNKLIPATHGISLGSRMGYSRERNCLLLGFAQGDLWEFSLQGHSSYLVTEGHDRGELHGLASNPVVPEEYATVGDDGVVRIWHRRLKYVLRRSNIRVASRAIAYAPDGLSLVVGLGRPGHAHLHPKDGSLVVLRSRDLVIQREERKGKKHITDVVFTRSGDLVAAACYDGRVFVCDYHTLATVFVLDLDTRRPALRLDLSSDDSLLRIVYQPDRLLYCSLDRQEVVENPAEVRDTVWRSTNCVFSWHTQGAFLTKASPKPRRLDTAEDEDEDLVAGGSTVSIAKEAAEGVGKATTTVASSNASATTANHQVIETPPLPVVTALAVHKPGKICVVAYEDGLVSLFPYPCIDRDNEVELCRVSSYVSRVVFAADNQSVYLIEAGSRSVMQASIVFPPVPK